MIVCSYFLFKQAITVSYPGIRAEFVDADSYVHYRSFMNNETFADSFQYLVPTNIIPFHKVVLMLFPFIVIHRTLSCKYKIFFRLLSFKKEMPQTNLTIARRKAAAIGVTVKPSQVKHKKLDVYLDGKRVASIGDLRYEDYNTHKDNERRRNYKHRHEAHRHKKGTPSYYADRILW